jgi:hypothetical protein
LLAPAIGAALLLGTTAAWADDYFNGDPDGPHRHRHGGALESKVEGNRVGITTDLWPAQDFFAAAMGLTAQIELSNHFALDVDIPWVVGDIRSGLGGLGGRQTAAGFGNITFGGHGMGHLSRDVVVYGGATVSIPTRYDFEGASSNTLQMQLLGTLSHAYMDPHRFMPGVLFVRIPLGLEARFARVLYYRGELNPVIWAPVSNLYDDKSPMLTLEHADEIEARAPFGFGGGLRFQATFVLTNQGVVGSGGSGGGDHVQAALEPFIGYEPRGTGLYARLGLLFALDTPLGFGFDADKLAAVRMQIGGKF